MDLPQRITDLVTEAAGDELAVPHAERKHPAVVSRRQALTGFAALGLSVAFLPLAPKVAEAQVGNVPAPLADGVDVLQCVSRLKIHHNKLDEFKRLAAECVELVRTTDTGTLQYEMYFNGSEAQCLVFERYRDSQALLEDIQHLGDKLAAISETFSGQVQICGTPSAELIEALQGLNVQFWAPFLAA